MAALDHILNTSEYSWSTEGFDTAPPSPSVSNRMTPPERADSISSSNLCLSCHSTDQTSVAPSISSSRSCSSCKSDYQFSESPATDAPLLPSNETMNRQTSGSPTVYMIPLSAYQYAYECFVKSPTTPQSPDLSSCYPSPPATLPVSASAPVGQMYQSTRLISYRMTPSRSDIADPLLAIHLTAYPPSNAAPPRVPAYGSTRNTASTGFPVAGYAPLLSSNIPALPPYATRSTNHNNNFYSASASGSALEDVEAGPGEESYILHIRRKTDTECEPILSHYSHDPYLIFAQTRVAWYREKRTWNIEKKRKQSYVDHRCEFFSLSFLYFSMHSHLDSHLDMYP